MEQIQEGLKHQFAKNIELVAQEKSKLLKYVTSESQETEIIQFETFGSSEARPRTRTQALGGAPIGYGQYPGAYGMPAATEYSMSSISRRQLTCSAWYWAETMDRNDKLNLISDPTNKYPLAAGRSMARAKDRCIINSIGANVGGGLNGATPIYFDYRNNVVPLGLLNNIMD